MDGVVLTEAALSLFRGVLYSMACIMAGAAIIALSIYTVLVCSEIFFSQPRSKIRTKTSQSGRLARFAAETPDPSATERSISRAQEHLQKGGVRVRDASITVVAAATPETDTS